MDTNNLLESRTAKDEFFATDPQSPLGRKSRRGFEGLKYYDPNPDLVFTSAVHPSDGAAVRIQTSDGAERTYRRLGTVSFQVNGEDASLTLFSTGRPGLFVPFRDATSGNETYGAGRYLDVKPNGDGTVTLDFNYAYNPFCAYDDAYSCPLPPVDNWLSVQIEAGEKTPK